jgi:lipopolysaccharide transport system ATP-binding protein
METEPVVQVRNVSKRYLIGSRKYYTTTSGRLTEGMTNALRHPLKAIGQSMETKPAFWALKNINFDVNNGEAVGIIGRNGAGKSTLLKILSQITYPTEGEIMLKGRVGSLLEVGTGFHPDLTGRENIYLNGAILGMTKKEIDQKFDAIVKFAEVEKFLDTPIKRFSSGMYLRLAFSVAAHLEPDILIADEVLAVGDQQFQQKCLGKMREVSEQGRTVIFVSHNMHAIRSLCETGVLLKSGSMVKKGSVDEVIEEYALSLEVQDNMFPVKTEQLTIDSLEFRQHEIDSNILDGTIPFNIIVRFELPERVDRYRMGIMVLNSMGDELIRSYFSDWDEQLEHIDAGTYMAELTFPEKFLAPGNYFIRVVAKKLGSVDMLAGHHVERAVSLTAPTDFNLGGGDPLQAQILLNRRWDVKKPKG